MEEQKWPEAAPGLETQPHLLLIGGDKKNFLPEKFGCPITHIDTRKRGGKIDINLRNMPTLALIFTDFINHPAKDAAVKRCKRLNIPFVLTSGGVHRAVEEASKHGHDWLRDYVKNGKGIRNTTKLPPSKPKPKLDIRPFSRATKIAKIGNHSFEIIKTKMGMWSLIIKRGVLDEVLEFVEHHGMGKGDRRRLTIPEARIVANMLEAKYGFEQYSIAISANNIVKNVNFARGAMTSKQSARMEGKKALKKKKAAKKKEAATEVAAKLSLNRKRASIQGTAAEVFLADMSQVMNSLVDINTKQGVLYETIAELKVENTAFVEQIDQQSQEIQDLKAEVKKWKTVATKDS